MLLPRTNKVTLSLTTDIAAACRFATSNGVAYESMGSSFTADGAGTTHTAAITGLFDGSNRTYYVRCRSDEGGVNVDDFIITFKVGSYPMPMYRSVGPGSTSALANEASGTVAIFDWRATFSNALPARVGVGDVLQYDTTGDVTPDAIAIVYGRISNTELVVRRANGGVPTPVLASAHWALLRAYTSLANAENGIENTGIDAGLVNFDTWTGGKDLVTPNEVWNIACYGDATDSATVNIAGWTTSASNYLRVFTPTLASEVGVSQRHQGVWNNGRYHLSAVTNEDDLISITGADFVRIEGLQLRELLEWAVSNAVIMVADTVTASSAEIVISDNIVTGTIEKDSTEASGIDNMSAGTVWVMNNIIYDMTGSSYGVSGIRSYGTGTIYAYNNTVVNCDYGLRIKPGKSGVIVAANNLVQGITSGYVGSFAAASSNNLSNKIDAPGANPLNERTVTFANVTADDFHLAAGDSQAHDAGIDLSGVAKYPCDDDIDGQARTGSWDVGADEID